jgi:glycosyltransferase involved in cell wall biosynthesis
MSAISIVIPVRNGAAFIGEAINSALAEGDLVAEVLVVDDGSNDKTREIVSSIPDPRVQLLSRPLMSPGGVSVVRNTGLAAARGEWVMFLDADDRLRPGALAALIEQAGDAIAVYGDYERIGVNGNRVGRRNLIRRREKPSGDILPRLLAGNFIVNGGVMLVRTAAFRDLGGFDAGLRYCEDWYAWCRLAAAGRIVYRSGLHVLDYRVHGQSTMMGATVTLEDYRPALDAIFADATLMSRIDPVQRASLMRRAEAHLGGYLVTQSIRARRYGSALQALGRMLARHPAQTPRLLLMSGAALAGI